MIMVGYEIEMAGVNATLAKKLNILHIKIIERNLSAKI